MKEYEIAIVPGDGIGHEIVPAGIEVLNAVANINGFKINTQSFPFGAGYYKEHGDFMSPDGMDVLRGFDAIYFGAVGLADVDDGKNLGNRGRSCEEPALGIRSNDVSHYRSYFIS